MKDLVPVINSFIQPGLQPWVVRTHERLDWAGVQGIKAGKESPEVHSLARYEGTTQRVHIRDSKRRELVDEMG